MIESNIIMSFWNCYCLNFEVLGSGHMIIGDLRVGILVPRVMHGPIHVVQTIHLLREGGDIQGMLLKLAF